MQKKRKVKEGDFIQRQYGCFRSPEILRVDDVEKDGIWAHRIKPDKIGSIWIPIGQVVLANDKVLKLSISAEDADHLATTHNTSLDHKATKEWLNAIDGQYPVVLLRNSPKRKEIFIGDVRFYKTILYYGKPPKRTTSIRMVFSTFINIKV